MCNTDRVDTAELARQLVRAVRGRRTQAAFSRRIGCRSNVLYTWEAGRRFPTARRFFEVAQRAGIDAGAALGNFLRSRPGWLKTEQLAHSDGVVRLLAELQGNRSISDLARATGKSRFAVARWLSGQTEPRLPDFLLLIEATSYRLLDFVAALVDPAQLPLIGNAWRDLSAARQAAYTSPWCHVVLRLLETERIRALPSIGATELAEELALSIVEARAALELLETTGQIAREGRRWRVKQTLNVDLAEDPEAVRRLKAWSAEIGLRRIQNGSEGLYSYNLFCVSERDYQKLQQLQRAYFRQLRAIVAESTPSERVVMANLQLFALSRSEP
jgi:transcriptional regulator with XRE-family HTH domain